MDITKFQNQDELHEFLLDIKRKLDALSADGRVPASSGLYVALRLASSAVFHAKNFTDDYDYDKV